MHTHDLTRWRHAHRFGTGLEGVAEQRTRIIIALTVAMMAIEIAAGLVFNSMALLADGWHMSTHAGALGIAAFAYAFARRHADDERFTFGTGKVGTLAGFASAITLVMVAAIMAWESGQRLFSAQSIAFDEALLVAGLGLAVNLASAVILGGHGQDHVHAHDGQHHDHNLRAAYFHVLADAVTSILAIAALLFGKYLDWWWMDPAMGVLGALVIVKWAYGLLRQTSAVLVDCNDDEHLRAEVRCAIENDADNRLADLHLWQIGPGHWAAIVSLVTDTPRGPDHYRRLLSNIHELSHVSIEVHPCPGETCPS